MQSNHQSIFSLLNLIKKKTQKTQMSFILWLNLRFVALHAWFLQRKFEHEFDTEWQCHWKWQILIYWRYTVWLWIGKVPFIHTIRILAAFALWFVHAFTLWFCNTHTPLRVNCLLQFSLKYSNAFSHQSVPWEHNSYNCMKQKFIERFFENTQHINYQFYEYFLWPIF